MGLTHTLLPTARDKVGVHCDMMKWLYLFCKRSAGWLRETCAWAFILSMSDYLSLSFLHTHNTHTHNLCMWLCEHVHIRGEVYLLNHPVDIAHCVCGVKLWTSSHWRVCLWASLCPLSFTELKPLRTDSLARVFCLLDTSALITEHCFLFMTFLCLPYMTITFQDTCILSHLHIISAFSLSFP